MYLPCGKPSLAQIVWTLIFVGSVIGGAVILRQWQLGLIARVIIVLVPLAAGGGCVWAIVGDMRRMDELQQRIWLEAVSLAFAATVVVLFCEPVFRRAGFVVPLTNDIVSASMMILLVLAMLFSARRYR